MALGEYLQGKPISPVSPEARTQVITTPTVVPPAAATAVMPELAGSASYTRASGSGSSSGNRGKSKKSSSALPVVITLVVVLIVLLVGIGLYFAFCSGGGGNIEVPRVVGMTEEDARSVIEQAELTVGDVKQQSSETVEAGLVISQSPSAQTKVAEGTKVNLVISSGSGNIEVPSLVGLTPAEAELLLSGLKLVYTTGESKPSADIESGKIISHTPPAGSKVVEGSKVVCVISSGPETGMVPNVFGMWKTDAETQLLAAGFKVAFAEEVYSNMDAGRVVNQDLIGESTKGQTVTLTLSKGPEPVVTPTVTVPNVVGMDLNAATIALASLGLVINYSGDVSGKTVQSQDPTASTVVDQGTVVTVVFGP